MKQTRRRVLPDVRAAWKVSDFSQRMSWSPYTTRRKLKSGLIAGVKVGRGGHWRIPTAELVRLTGGGK
jgi:hypothetical protein